SSLFAGSTRITLTGATATESAFKRLAPGRRVVHVATHGYFLDQGCPSRLDPAGGAKPAAALGDNPLRLSGLALTGANHRETSTGEREDGMLSAEEIASLDLSGVEWAVLSGCGTGEGEVLAGEGVLGLRRAFQIAGAGSLIMSLWPEEDEATRCWM